MHNYVGLLALLPLYPTYAVFFRIGVCLSITATNSTLHGVLLFLCTAAFGDVAFFCI